MWSRKEVLAILFATTRVSQSYVELLQTDGQRGCADVERMNSYPERRSGVIDRLHLVDQVRHRHLTEPDTVPDSIRERLMEIFDSWHRSTDDQTLIPRKVKLEVSALVRELQASGLFISEQQLLRDSVVEGWRIVRGKYSDSHLRRFDEQG